MVDTSRLLWWPLLRGVILPLRSPRVAKLYASVWMEGGSPSLESAVDELLAEHVDHIVVLPLYPQYSCSTVGAVWDELARILARKRSIPGISFIRDYADNHDYINALANSVRASFAKHGEPDQSRFGREPWLMPYTDETLKMLGEKGVGHIQVMCPGFAADCLETLEEIAEQNREVFLGAGGKKYEYIPALNATPEHIEMMANLVAAYR